MTLRPLLAAAVSIVLSAGSASASHSLADLVKDGPAADLVRRSLRYLEKGEEASEDQVKLDWYERGKKLAEEAVAKDDASADAHFALFANWGRGLQTEGWVRNAHHLPALWRELDRALELNPDHSPALGAKGGLYLNLPSFLGGSVAKAEPLLRRAVDLDPNAVGARLELAECYLQTERPDEAKKLVVAALGLAQDQQKSRFVDRATRLLQEIDGGRADSLAASAAGS